MVFDSNMLIHAVNEDSEVRRPCLERLREASLGVSAFLTWSICYEFLRVSTHRNILSSPLTPDRALRFLNALLDSPGFGLLQPTDRHQSVLAQTLVEVPEIRGNVMHDLHKAVLMRENGVDRICTFDRDFLRFPFLTVVAPLR